MTCHSDYPNFYQRLYALLDANVLHVRYRARFFRLIDTFLRSALLPASLVASFIKRLSRLALTGPPAGVIMVIPFVYNLFKRHPGCMVMLQRLDDGDGEYNGESESNVTTDHGPRTTNHKLFLFRGCFWLLLFCRFCRASLFPGCVRACSC